MYLVLLAKAGGLVIDWTQMPTYNTIMSVSAGAGLLSLLVFARQLTGEPEIDLRAWSMAFAVPGFILTVTGVHMTLTWPMAKYFPFDNIIFGETSFGFGVLLLAAAFYLWTQAAMIVANGDAARMLARSAQSMSLFIIGMGLSLIAIAGAGMYNKLFAAPPEEPISGMFASYPWIEATFISGMFALVGIGAILLPLALRELAKGTDRSPVQSVIGICWGLTGLGFLLFGALNFFTHIGLIVNTMPSP
jgi:uncharacterized membrane protein